MFFAWLVSENAQTLRIDHDAGGDHEHDWNGGFLACLFLDTGAGVCGLSLNASTIRLDHLSHDPHDEPQPACRRQNN
jgi:hypothetical protein